ncbi:hypothetical protein PV11_07205 [Exophiala sideris]|uniref:Xylanolytic transcriptional activator regulatory domain-containing protein n=1 Tax=Exophiala sideris TaxID=1016849 RepID=A0A0D1WWW6_9EURO|nr:hypothetical protein PV11_07205 [Exophiala sideris]
MTLIAPRLFEELIPQDSRLLRSLVDAYFHHVHPLRCLGFVHKPTFIHALEKGTLKDEYIEALIYIICAFGARYLYWDLHQRLALDEDENLVPGVRWARKAKEMAMRDMLTPSVQNLMALILISEYGAGAHGNATAFILSGCCHRLARLLGLDDEREGSPTSGPEMCRLEGGRRLMWSCFILNSIIESGVDTDNSSKGLPPKLPLPASESEFISQTSHGGREERWLVAMESPDATRNVDYRGQTVYLIYLRTQVLRLIRQSLSQTEIQSPDSAFIKLLTRLQSWYANVPARLYITDLNVYILKELNMLGPVFFIHFAYHAAVADLTRVSLPGFDFPLAATFADVPHHFRQNCQRLCRQHADEISRLIEIGYQDTNHTVASNGRREREQAERNMRTNTKLMTLMGRDGSHVHVRPLLSLLYRFGFGNIATNWDPRSSANEVGAAEISDPADSNHLSHVSILRMARAEMQRRETQSIMGPASPNSCPVDSQQAQDGSDQMLGSSHGIASRASEGFGGESTLSNWQPAQEQGWSDSGATVKFATDGGSRHLPDRHAFISPFLASGNELSGFQDEQVSEAPRLIEMSNSDDRFLTDQDVLLQDPAFFPGSSPSNQFADDYAKLATEMSDYITWNATDYTPWSTFYPFSEDHPTDP